MINALWAITALLACLAAATAVELKKHEQRTKDVKTVFAEQLAQQIRETERLKKSIAELGNALAEMDRDEESGERLRHGALLRELNDELEKGLRMEQEWNTGLASILGYSMKTATEGMKNE